MPKVSVYDVKGAVISELELKDEVFGIKPNKSVIHEAILCYLANQRQGTQSTLTRSEVRGGGRKPWRQKGTGNARHGSIRSPIWRHGGVALAPKPRSYSYSLNKKVRRLAIKSALSAKVADNELIVLDAFTMDEFKTKSVVELLKALGVEKKALIVLDTNDTKVIRSASNIPGIKTTQATTLNVYDILNHNQLIVLKNAAEVIQEVYA